MSPRARPLTWLATTLLLLVAPRTAMAQGDETRLAAEVEALSGDPEAGDVQTEVERARELLRLASTARENGDVQIARTIRSVLALQIRLIRALRAVARLEHDASDAERRLMGLEERRRRAREQVEHLLERLADQRRSRGAAR